MEKSLTRLIKASEELKATIDNASINASFDEHGWNQVHIDKSDISNLLHNFISKLKNYGDAELPNGLTSTIEDHIKNINRLNITSQTYFTNNASYLVHNVPSILLTLYTVIDDVDFELFSFQNIQDKKLLPRGLAARLRSTEIHLDSIDESSETLHNKIKAINDAHEAAESLPTDLASLKEAKSQLNELIKNAKSEVESLKSHLITINEEASSFKINAKKASEEAESFKVSTQKFSEEASSLVAQCDDALQITTTQGLAAGFDQKANELKNSIWIWIGGLLIALLSGAYIGSERVLALTQALNNQLTTGQAILHTIMSIFSIGGPLWLAWISTQQINQRFKLSEDYSYKATVAKSFTGFKKFAERFDPSTEERLFNSTLDRLDEMPLRLIAGKDYNSPWHEFIDSDAFKSAITVVPTLAKEAGKFASKTALREKPKGEHNVKINRSPASNDANEEASSN